MEKNNLCDLARLQIEELRGRLEEYRFVVIEAYIVKKWLSKKKLDETGLETLNNLIEGDQRNVFHGQVRSRYVAMKANHGSVIVSTWSDTNIKGRSWNDRHPPTKQPSLPKINLVNRTP